jgi:anaerobic ribonucleoside-triphosphate reductase
LLNFSINKTEKNILLELEKKSIEVKSMREKIKNYQIETGNLYNLEATPAESTSYKFAKRDKEIYPNIFTSGNNTITIDLSSNYPYQRNILINIYYLLHLKKSMMKLVVLYQ